MSNNKWKLQTKDFVWMIICLGLTICFGIGLIIKEKENAFDIVSGGATVASIALSIVAMIYTMISGSNAAQINIDTQNRLSSIDSKIELIEKKTSEQKETAQKIKVVASAISTYSKENNEELPLELQEILDNFTVDMDEEN